MKHLSSVVLAAALIAAGVTACFKDPTSGLRSGASRLELNRSAITLVTGDSLAVQAELKDDQGNVLNAAAITWSSDNAAVASVRVDSIPIPGPAFSRAFVLAVGVAGGVAHVTATDGNLTSTFRVLVVPARLTALATASVTGTAHTDTISTTVLGVTTNYIFSAGDTVVFTTASGGALSFRADSSQVSLGTDRAYIVSRTATVIKAIALKSFRGRPWVTKLTWAGPAEVGNVALDSLQSDSVVVSKPRFYGTVTQTGDTMFLNAQAGSSFDTTTATPSVVRFGAASAVVLSRTVALLKAISPSNYTGVVTVTRVKVGTATIDSVKTAAGYTINQAAFGGTVVTTGNLVDVVKLYGTAVTKFTTTPAASVSNVTIGGKVALVVLRTADSMYVHPVVPSTGPVAVSNVNVGGTIIPTLSTAGNVVIGPATGEANEPGNDARATATTLAFTGAADTIVVYGAIDCEDDGTACPGNGDIIDYYQIAYAGGAKLRAIVTWFGNGSGGAAYNDTNNPDIDVAIRDAAANYFGTNTSSNGSGSIMPETATTTTLAAGTYYIRVMAWLTPSPIVYKLQLLRTP